VRRLLLTLLAVVALAAGCGSTGGESAGTGSGIPDVEVTDLATGDPVALASVAEPGLPTLVWFWAPH
jgi:hypothetical protein